MSGPDKAKAAQPGASAHALHGMNGDDRKASIKGHGPKAPPPKKSQAGDAKNLKNLTSGKPKAHFHADTKKTKPREEFEGLYGLKIGMPPPLGQKGGHIKVNVGSNIKDPTDPKYSHTMLNKFRLGTHRPKAPTMRMAQTPPPAKGSTTRAGGPPKPTVKNPPVPQPQTFKFGR